MRYKSILSAFTTVAAGLGYHVNEVNSTIELLESRNYTEVGVYSNIFTGTIFTANDPKGNAVEGTSTDGIFSKRKITFD